MADDSLLSRVMGTSTTKSYILTFPSECEEDVVDIVRSVLKKQCKHDAKMHDGEYDIVVSGKDRIIKFKFDEPVKINELKEFAELIVNFYEAAHDLIYHNPS